MWVNILLKLLHNPRRQIQSYSISDKQDKEIYYISDYIIGGVGQVIYNLYNVVPSYGYSPNIIIPLKIVRYTNEPLMPESLFLLKKSRRYTLPKLLNMLKNIALANTIHVHATLTLHKFTLTSILYIIKSVKSNRHIITFHTSWPSGKLPRLKIKLLCTLLKQMPSNIIVTVPSRLVVKSLSKYCSNVNNIKVIYNGIDFNVYNLNNKNVLNKRYNHEEYDIIILYVGRLVREKGVLILPRLLSLVNRYWKVLFIIQGFGPLQSTLLESFRKKGIKYIKINNYVEREKLAELYKVADITILPSIRGEAMPLTLIESIACGTPVVLSNWLFREFHSIFGKYTINISSFLRKIEKIIDIIYDLKKNIEQDYIDIKDRFDIYNIVRKFINLIEK